MRDLNPSTFLAETLRPFATGQAAGLPSLFDRYLLDPGDDDERAIDDRLDQVKAIWQRSFEHPKYGQLAKALAAEHDDAGFALGDPQERARLAAKSVEEEERRKAEQEAAVEGWRQLLAERIAGGGLTPNSRSVLERLAKQRGIDPALVDAELDRAPVATPPDLLEPKVREQIARVLQDLARDGGEEKLGLTLFHAIGLEGITEDVTAIQRQYAAVAERTEKLAIGQVATTYKTVLSNVKLHLLDKDPRAYIESVVADVTAAMEFEGAQAASGGRLGATEAEALLRAAMARGLSADLARRVVTELARQNDAAVEATAPVDYVSCPKCNTPHPRPDAPDACKRCGQDLFVTCPEDGCGTRNDATALRCSNCHTDLRRFSEAKRRLRRLAETAEAGRIALAVSEMQEIATVLGPEAVPARLRAELDRLLGEAELAWKAAEGAIAESRLYAARAGLRRLCKSALDLPGATGDAPGVRLREVDRRIAEAEALLERARSATGSAREAALVEVVRLVADCEEAVAALAAIPPEPPHGVRISLDATGPVVEWAPSPTAGAAYAVRRVDAGTNATVELPATPGLRIDDREAPTGAVLRYEVHTLRGRARSSPARSPEILVAREVQDVRVQDLDGEVRVTWQPVPATARVIVERKDERGTTSAPVADRGGLVDRDVRNGERFAYRISVEYAAPAGRGERTAGITAYGQPAAPPKGLETLSIHDVHGGVVIGFERPVSGTVAIVRAAEEPQVDLGESVDPATLGRLGVVLPAAGDEVRDEPPPGACWYLPVTVAGGSAVAGRAVRHLALGAVENVRVAQSATNLRVTWSWPDGVRVAKVLWRRDRHPVAPDEPGVQSAWVRLGEYKDHGGFTIEAAGAAPAFVAVVAAMRVDGALIAGTTIAKSARATHRSTAKTDLRYAVRRPRFRGRLDVEVDVPDGVRPPSLVLVARAGDLLPRRAEDGDVVARFGGADPLSSSVSLSGRSRPIAVRLFLESSSSGAAFELFHPPVDDLVIR